MRQALEPFARYANQLEGVNWVPDSSPLAARPDQLEGAITVADLRRAREALSAPPQAAESSGAAGWQLVLKEAPLLSPLAAYGLGWAAGHSAVLAAPPPPPVIGEDEMAKTLYGAEYDIESYPWETRDEADQLVYRMQARAAIALINSKQR